MSERDDLMCSISVTIQDYRSGDLPTPNSGHVDRWIRQFDDAAQLPVLREMDHVLDKTYFSREFVAKFFANQINHEKLAGASPRDFWDAAHVLDIQQHGLSQHEIRGVFGESLLDEHGLAIDDCGRPHGAFVYLDDALFTGSRATYDLSAWIADSAPSESTLHVLVIATHRLGEWQLTKRLGQAAADAGKKLSLHIWAAVRLENRKAYRNSSDVLWPAFLPDDAELAAYLAAEERFPFEPRRPGVKSDNGIFSSEEGRQLLEREFLLAGMRIRGFSREPSKSMRPLGFSPFGLGFGSTIVTYRNCPNNCPLGLWWGDPNASSDHPFSQWYPLFPRKTYEKEKPELATPF